MSHDMPESVPYCYTYLFADDTKLLKSMQTLTTPLIYNIEPQSEWECTFINYSLSSKFIRQTTYTIRDTLLKF